MYGTHDLKLENHAQAIYVSEWRDFGDRPNETKCYYGEVLQLHRVHLHTDHRGGL